MAGVEDGCGVTDFSKRRQWGPEPRYPKVESYKHTGQLPIVIAGPCSVEGEAQAEDVCKALKAWGPPTYVRGGVHRAGTYPPDRPGLRHGLLKSWASIVRGHGMRTVVEVIDLRDLDRIEPHADALQVGARQMQNYGLLDAVSRSGKTVTLKRNVGATMDEFLGAAEYLLRGSCKPVLVERGSSTFMRHVRWDLCVSIIPAIKRLTGLPIIVDASHGTGRRDLVVPMTLAGIAAGADGFLVEVHPNPEKSLSDADQALDMRDYPWLIDRARAVMAASRGQPLLRVEGCNSANSATAGFRWGIAHE